MFWKDLRNNASAVRNAINRDFKQRLRKILVRWPEVIFFRHSLMPQVKEVRLYIPVILFFIAIIPTRLLCQMLANPS